MSIPSEISRIDVGQVANDGTGDDLRDAFIKINNNFTYVGTRLGLAVTGANLGASGQEVFKEVVDAQLRFRKINAAGNLTIATENDVIVLRFSPSADVDFNGQNIIDVASLTASSTISANAVSAETGEFTTLSGDLTGDVTGNVTGNVSGNAGTVTNGVYTVGSQTINGVKTFTDEIQGNIQGILSGSVFGTVVGNVTGLIRTEPTDTYVDVTALQNGLNTFDFGVINPVGLNSFKDPASYLLYAVGTDMGTFNNPSEFDIDAGNI